MIRLGSGLVGLLAVVVDGKHAFVGIKALRHWMLDPEALPVIGELLVGDGWGRGPRIERKCRASTGSPPAAAS